MTLLELAQQHVPLRRVGREYHGPCPACGHGPTSTPQSSDRFSVKGDREMWFCRTCTPEGGGPVKFLMRFEGKKCPEAHALLGLTCDSATCPAREKCPARADRRTTAPAPRRLQPIRPTAPETFTPAAVVPPAERWAASAAKLVETAHAALLANPEQIAWLAGRGLPMGAVEKYRLGWIAEDLYRPRAAWGLPDERWPDGREKKLKLHRGLLIPTFVDGVPHRLRIRRPKNELQEGEAAYLEVKGSGNDRVILNPQARAVVVVESDLDALLVDWHAGDLVGAMPTVSAPAKPKASTWPALQAALCILVASDFESVYDEARERWVSAGGSAAQWWQKQFPRAKRWPVPTGKDPGEYAQQGGDIRAWVMEGLPPVFRLQVAAPAVEVKETPAQVQPAAAPPLRPVADLEPVHRVHRTDDGREIPYILVSTQGQHRQMIDQHPGVAVVGRQELSKIDPEAVDVVLLAKGVFQGCRVVETVFAG